MTIKCIAFDLDNTLWECDPLIIKAEQKFHLWLQSAYPQITDNFTEEALVAHRMNYIQARPELHYDLTSLRKSWMRQIASEIDGITATRKEHCIRCNKNKRFFRLCPNDFCQFDAILVSLDIDI